MVKTVRRCGLLLAAAVTVMVGCDKPRSVPVEQVQVKPVTAAELLQLVRDSGAKVVLVNVWATWCGPCREEFPDLVRLARDHEAKGLKVMFVSTDFDSELPQVKEFLARHGVNFPTYLKAEKDMPFINAMDERWTGAIPATFVYDGSGKLRHFWEGMASYREFEQRVLDVLGK